MDTPSFRFDWCFKVFLFIFFQAVEKQLNWKQFLSWQQQTQQQTQQQQRKRKCQRASVRFKVKLLFSKNGPKVTARETARDTIAESFGMVILLFVRPAIKANFNMSNKLSKSS